MAGINAAIIKQTLVMALQASAAGVAFFTRLTKNIERKMIPKTTIVPNRIYVISMIKLLLLFFFILAHLICDYYTFFDFLFALC